MSAHNPVGFRSPVTRVPPRGGVCASSSRPSALMNPRPVRAGDEAGLEPVGAPLRSSLEDHLELARRGRQQDDVYMAGTMRVTRYGKPSSQQEKANECDADTSAEG